jgi:hypothetical protein
MPFIFKIRRKSDVLFSSGGCWPTFGPVGKVWQTAASLKLHLSLFKEKRINLDGEIKDYPNGIFFHPYKDCEIIPYEFVEVKSGIMTVHDYINKEYPLAAIAGKR